jgi:predicted SprT family Zn-dependent metalloprotease
VTPQEVARLMRATLDAHGLHHWLGTLDRAKRRLGICRYDTREISLSLHHLNRPDADILNTIRHEVAHALAGRGAGHGPIWKAQCRITGARPQRCGAVAVEVAGRYVLRCTGCGGTWQRHKMGARVRLQILAGQRWHAACGRTRGRLEIQKPGAAS